jgi:hypothetical protein
VEASSYAFLTLALDDAEFVRTLGLLPVGEGFLLPSGWEAGWDLYHVGKLRKSEKLLACQTSYLRAFKFFFSYRNTEI